MQHDSKGESERKLDAEEERKLDAIFGSGSQVQFQPTTVVLVRRSTDSRLEFTADMPNRPPSSIAFRKSMADLLSLFPGWSFAGN